MAKKEFTFRGKTIEELKKLDTREFAKYLKSRQRRTVLRQFNDIEKFIKRCIKKMEKEKKIKTHLRHLVIVPKMVGMTISVYNGKEFIPFKIKSQMLGHRLGEFSQTRTKVQHGSPGIGATRSSAALSVR
jgi:small subunit ribosomal protein S19